MSNVSFTHNTDESLHCACDNCEWVGLVADVVDIVDVQERLDPGSIVPAGQCPACGALAYLDETDAPTVGIVWPVKIT